MHAGEMSAGKTAAPDHRNRSVESTPRLTIPNILTGARIAAIPLIVGLFFAGTGAAQWAILVLFIGAAITDFFDGWLARKLDQHSELGRLLDPIADKLMVAAVLIMMAGFGTVGQIHVIAIVAILARELAVTGLREFLAERAIQVPVTPLAKWKTAVQMVAITILLSHFVDPSGRLATVGLVFLWLAAALTLITGWTYFRTGLSAAQANTGQTQ